MARSSVVLALALTLLAPAAPSITGTNHGPRLLAQERGDPIPLSQYQRLTQRIGWAVVDLEYRRPVARGRELFGALVPFDEAWTPSADSAVVLTLSDDIILADRPVEAGSYSLWLIPRAPGRDWTLILSRAARVFHAPYPQGRDYLRVDLPVTTGDHMETLALYFPEVNRGEAVLRLHWGETILPIPLRLPESGVRQEADFLLSSLPRT